MNPHRKTNVDIVHHIASQQRFITAAKTASVGMGNSRMDAFSDAEVIKLTALSAAFVIGLIVCVFVVIRESVELKRRRKAKELMYKDAVHREVRRKRSQINQGQQPQAEAQELNFKSFA